MNILEQVAKWIGVELNKPFQIYDEQAEQKARKEARK